MKHIKNIFVGFLIGAGAILPGISSGVFCVIFGIYDKLVDSVLNFFKDIKKNITFLLPIGIGGFVGVIVLGNLLKYLFATFPIQTNMIFIGFILGSVPKLFKTANKKKSFHLHYIIYTIITFAIAIFLLQLENYLSVSNYITSSSVLFLILSGFLMSVGLVVPGVSSTVILMILGVYTIYLDAIAGINLSILIPMGIGLVIGGIIFLNLIQYSLENHYTKTYYSIIRICIRFYFSFIS